MAKKQKKKATRRSKVKNPALKRQYNSKIRQEYLDYDYLGKLNEEELEWLNNFTAEWNNANFKHKGDLIDKTDEGRKASFNRNNSRNRCVYSQAKAMGRTIQVTDNDLQNAIDNNLSYNEPEELWIRLLEDEPLED